MKFEKQFEEFISLRIEGKSFDDIAGILQTSKPTLIDWNKKAAVRTAIDEGKAMKINCLLKAYQLDFESRLKTSLERSKKINDELSQRELTELKISTNKLLRMSIASDNSIKKLIDQKVRFGTNPGKTEAAENEDGFFDLPLDD